MRLLTIIPARSGSKGIPGKNIKLLGNKPLIAYSIESALNSGCAGKIIVDTDSEEIAKIATKCGAEVPYLRPAHLALDETHTLEVVKNAIRTLGLEGEIFDAVMLLQPTSPFRTNTLIQESIETFQNGNFDSLISVLPVPHEYNPHWVFEEAGDGNLKIATGETTIIPRRQELPQVYFRDGQVYITKCRFLFEQDKLVGGNVGFVETDIKNYCNLDTNKDWEKAEDLLKQICAE